MNVIGDIGGRYDTLLALLKQMPDDEPVSLGDMVDRGPQSDEVVAFFMDNGRAIMGNHEHMMWQYLQHQKDQLDRMDYDTFDWVRNGGIQTLISYRHNVPNDVILWLKNLPLRIDYKDFILTHAPYHKPIYDSGDTMEILWNRYYRGEIDDGKINVYGHNHEGMMEMCVDGIFKGTHIKIDQKTEGLIEGMNYVCIDTDHAGYLTGLNLNNGKFYFQKFIE